MRALIVEDNANVSAVLRQWLEQARFTVTVTDSMAVAAEIIEQTPELEVITLDLNLPDSRAKETIQRIAEIRKVNPNALLVVVSGVLTSVDEREAVRLGADACLEKHDVTTEKGWWQKLKDVVGGLLSAPTDYAKRIPLIEALSSAIAKECDRTNSAIGITTPPQPKVDSGAG